MSKKHHKHTGDTCTQEPVQAEVATEEAVQTAEEETAQPAQPDYRDQYVRLYAEFENFRKRTEREKISFLSYGKKQLAEKLLPSYEILLRQAEKWGKQQADGETKSILEGVNLILSEMQKAFASEGIVRIETLNKPYDPATEEAVGMVPVPPEQDGLVIQEVQMGFMLNGSILRPARVLVGQHTQEN